jgi:hypothetical protein
MFFRIFVATWLAAGAAAAQTATVAPFEQDPGRSVTPRPGRGASDARGPYRFTARAEGGLGLLTGHAGFSAESWRLRRIGVGWHAGTFSYAQPFVRHGSAYGGAATLGARTLGPRSFGVVNVAAGFGHFTDTYTGGLCLDFWGNEDCPTPETTSGTVPYLAGSVGYLFHPGGVELGPILRVDSVGPVTAATLNLGLGFGVRGR